VAYVFAQLLGRKTL